MIVPGIPTEPPQSLPSDYRQEDGLVHPTSRRQPEKGVPEHCLGLAKGLDFAPWPNESPPRKTRRRVPRRRSG